MPQKDIKTELAALQSQRPDLKLYTPETSDYEALRKTFIITEARPAAIARPQTAQDVQTLVRTCVNKSLEFNVRTGGHNCVGRTLVDGAVLIDMRDIAQVQVSEDRSTAKVGGGILAGGLLKALGEYGLITPWCVNDATLTLFFLSSFFRCYCCSVVRNSIPFDALKLIHPLAAELLHRLGMSDGVLVVAMVPFQASTASVSTRLSGQNSLTTAASLLMRMMSCSRESVAQAASLALLLS